MDDLPRYAVYLKPAVERALKKTLDQMARRRIARAIDGLAATPRPAGAVTLQGSDGLRRIRIGDYRVGYTLEQATRTRLIVTIGRRRDVYRR